MSVIQTTLERLQPLLPLQGVIHVGVGGAHNMQLYEQLNIKNAVFIEANPHRCESLNKAMAGRHGWISLCELISAKDKRKTFYETSNLNENGLIAPDDLQPFWQNLKLRGRKKRQALSLKTCLETHHQQLDPDKFNILNISCFPALSILKGAKELLKKMDVVIARAVEDEQVIVTTIKFSQKAYSPSARKALAQIPFDYGKPLP